MKTIMTAKTLIAGILTVAGSVSMADGLIKNSGGGQYVVSGNIGEASYRRTLIEKVKSCEHHTFKHDNCQISNHDTGVPDPAVETTVSFDTFAVTSQNKQQEDKLLKTKESLSFSFLGDDGTSLGVEFKYANDEFSNLFLSKRNLVRVRSQWKLVTCDSQDMNLPESDIDSIVANLRRFDFSRYMNCTLRPITKADSISPTSYAHYSEVTFEADSFAFSETSNLQKTLRDGGYHNENSPALIVKDNGDIEFHPYGTDSNALVRYFQSTQQPDPNKQQIVFNSTKRFVSLIKSYGNLLTTIATSKPAEKAAAQSAWVSKNKGQIIQLLSTIESNLSGTSSIDKLNVVTSINKAYSYIQLIEQYSKVTTTLDEVIGSGN